MRFFRAIILPLFFAFLIATASLCQTHNSSAEGNPDSTTTPGSFDEVVGRIVEREHFFNQQVRQYHPLLETYIQNLKDSNEMGPVPASDRYFLGRLDVDGQLEDHFANHAGQQSIFKRFNIYPKVSELYSVRFLPGGFAQMVLLDRDFNRQFYTFNYVRREFLGEVRCLAIDVHPRKGSGDGRFEGRIWVEDEGYNIVRFNGTYTWHRHLQPNSKYFHFDSWRLNLRPGLWLPAYVYSEETADRVGAMQVAHFKAQTRLWGYDLPRSTGNDAFTEIVVDSPQTIRDQSDANQDASPVQSERMWEREAEDNAIERLQKAGLMASEGEVDKVLQTVVNNLIFTNNLNIQPEVRTRVLLTTPLESFTIGHTIVLSRGLLDVLPDEASLAMILSHELAHIALGHRLDTKLAFNDRMFFSDESTFVHLDFSRDPAEDAAADHKALELLAHSPYHDQLGDAGLFLKALRVQALCLSNLIQPHLGSMLITKQGGRLAVLSNGAPSLDIAKVDQIAALPLGGRIKLDPWSSRIALVKGKPVALTTSREKMPFEIAPFFPYLVRTSTTGPDRVALTAPAGEKFKQQN
jgi:hypothetical protein